MKKIKLFLVLIVLVLLTGLSSCDLFVSFFGTTIDDRIEAFNDDVAAGNYSELKSHFHSDTVQRDDMTETYWTTKIQFANKTQIVNYSVSGTTVTGFEDYQGDEVVLAMKREGLDYMILSLTIKSDPDLIIKKIE